MAGESIQTNGRLTGTRGTRPNPRQRRASRQEKPDPAAEEFTHQTKVFFSALRAGDAAMVRKFLEKRDVNVNMRDMEDPLEPTPLLVACERQHYDVIKALVGARPKPADINLESTKGKRPIWWAAKYGDHKIAELLLETDDQKCEVNYLDKETGCTPLYRAILTNSTAVCGHLIHAGADVNLRRLGMSGDTASAESPLIKAVQLDNLEIVSMLVNSLCDMDARTGDGLTALHYAVAYRRYGIAHTLLNNKIPIRAKSSKGVTALTVAIEQRNPAMCKLLIEHGYNTNRKFDWGETPLEMAIKNHSEFCALMLIYEGCSLDVADGKPSYFLQAISEGLLQLVRVLIEMRPRYLSEPWLRHGYIPLSLYKTPHFYEELVEEASRPRHLMHLCRSVIFASVGKYPSSKLTKLQLPKKLVRFVSMADYFPSSMFTQKSIFTDECPYDCCSNCDKTQCHQLDFSSSSDDELDIHD